MPSVSRLAIFCEKFIQAGWLAALVVAPLFFNIYSSRVFEPDKIALVRSIALAMLAAWLVLRAERWRGGRLTAGKATSGSLAVRIREWLQQVSADNPLALPALFFAVVMVLSTIASISPVVSFFGSYQRSQGLYSTLSYLVIFFLAASLIRSRADIDRVMSVAIIASFPVAFYGIIQHYFLDTLPWVGDVTTRVASTLGNSIFIGAFLIIVMPLTLARLISSARESAAQLARRTDGGSSPNSMVLVTGVAAALTALVLGAVWLLSFDVGARGIFSPGASSPPSPEQVTAALASFTFALSVTALVFGLWWVAVLRLRQRVSLFLLIPLYSFLLIVQLVALIFSQSRGPFIGMVVGVFAFGLLYALVRGGGLVRSGMVAVAAIAVQLVALGLVVGLAIPNSPLTALRDVPYLGRLGRVLELEGGTGRVRVLIWQGALAQVLPHEPLHSPTGGDDPLNPIRPLVGYGPETMYVAYSRFYPPELGRLEARTATPDRSHNETFDALVTTGIVGFAAENILFALIFYLALKWLGVISSPRWRNAFFAFWFGGGIVVALLLGVTAGWHFVGVALPLGMVGGFFIFLTFFSLMRRSPVSQSFFVSLWLIALTAAMIAHFVEIHFGIAIVSTRVYFWVLAAILVSLGRALAPDEVEQNDLSTESSLGAAVRAQATKTETANSEVGAAPRKERVGSRKNSRAARPTVGGRGGTSDKAITGKRPKPKEAQRVSLAPLATMSFLIGFVLAVMAFDFISRNNVAEESFPSALEVIISALTLRSTSEGLMSSPAMLLLFVITLVVGMGVAAAEWGRRFTLPARDWLTVLGLSLLLALAVLFSFLVYHVLLIAAIGEGAVDLIAGAVRLFVVFMFLVMAVVAVSLMFDTTLPVVWVSRSTNWVVAPVLALLAGFLIFSSNIDPIHADMLYKQAAGLGGEKSATAIALLRRALALQPNQDYYMLFLGRAYVDAARFASNRAEQREYLDRADQVLKQALVVNPYNTDHSANLARLEQTRAGMAETSTEIVEALARSEKYYDQALSLSPNTAHLYVQKALALLEQSRALQRQNETTRAAQVKQEALEMIDRAIQIDSTFCLSYAARAGTHVVWKEKVEDAVRALELARVCDVFAGEGKGLAVEALAQAGDEAATAGSGAQFETMIKAAAEENPSLELFTTLANHYSKLGNVTESIAAVDAALSTIPESDAETRKRYEDFRFTLLKLREAIAEVEAAPSDPEAHRKLAALWLAREQDNFALPEYQKVISLAPGDYDAARQVALLLVSTDQLAEAADAIARAAELAPESDKAFWESFDEAVKALGKGERGRSLALVEELAQAADSRDLALIRALRLLAAKLQGAG